MKANNTYNVVIANEACNFTATKYNTTLTGFATVEDADNAAWQALRDIQDEIGYNKTEKRYNETLGVWVLYNPNNGAWLLTAKIEEVTDTTTDTMNTETKAMNEVATVEFSELSHAAQCTDIYLHNTAEIYERYTVEAVKLVVNAFTNQGPVKLDDATAWDNLKFWISWQPVTKKALTAAVKLVKKYDHMTPTAKDIHEVTRNYAAYIVESAKYEVENC